MMNREKHPAPLLIDEAATGSLELATPPRWESVMPRLTACLSNDDEPAITREALIRLTMAADEYAHRKYIAQALSQWDLTSLFEAFPGHPFLKGFAALYHVAEDEQRLALLEGVGSKLLEFAHWKGWLQHLQAPQTSLTAADIAPRVEPDQERAAIEETREPGSTLAARPKPRRRWTEPKRQKMSELVKERSKDKAVMQSGVKPGEWLTTREFLDMADIPYWKFQEMQRTGEIPFSPLRGVRGLTLLWRKTKVEAFVAQRARQNAK